MYIPHDTIPDFGTYSCGVCGFELDGPREAPAPTHAPTRPPLAGTGQTSATGVVHFTAIQYGDDCQIHH